MRAAMRPYSMAVAPDSFLAKRVMNFDISDLLFSGQRAVQRLLPLPIPQSGSPTPLNPQYSPMLNVNLPLTPVNQGRFLLVKYGA
jgi:hypothetical protein